jgi:hypothetical protein
MVPVAGSRGGVVRRVTRLANATKSNLTAAIFTWRFPGNLSQQERSGQICAPCAKRQMGENRPVEGDLPVWGVMI